MRSKQITITVPPELYEIVHRAARKQDRSISNLIMHALSGYMKRYGYDKADTKRKNRELMVISKETEKTLVKALRQHPA